MLVGIRITQISQMASLFALSEDNLVPRKFRPFSFVPMLPTPRCARPSLNLPSLLSQKLGRRRRVTNWPRGPRSIPSLRSIYIWRTSVPRPIFDSPKPTLKRSKHQIFLQGFCTAGKSERASVSLSTNATLPETRLRISSSSHVNRLPDARRTFPSPWRIQSP